MSTEAANYVIGTLMVIIAGLIAWAIIVSSDQKKKAKHSSQEPITNELDLVNELIGVVWSANKDAIRNLIYGHLAKLALDLKRTEQELQELEHERETFSMNDELSRSHTKLIVEQQQVARKAFQEYDAFRALCQKTKLFYDPIPPYEVLVGKLSVL